MLYDCIGKGHARGCKRDLVEKERAEVNKFKAGPLSLNGFRESFFAFLLIFQIGDCLKFF